MNGIFNHTRVNVRELALVSMLASVSSVGRILCMSLPNIQPSSFIVIITAYVFGIRRGVMVAVVGTLISNTVIGQGPWTFWQIGCWSLIALFAGLLGREKANKWVMIIYSIIVGFAFGAIMDLWGYTFMDNYFAYWLSGILFDFNHAVCNALLFYIIGEKMIKLLQKEKSKYFKKAYNLRM